MTRAQPIFVLAMKILVGTQFYPTTDVDAARRQANCAASLVELPDADTVNVQWQNEVYDHPAIESLPVLLRDSRTVTGAAGARKPIVSDVLDALAAAADRRGLPLFLFVNSDIIVTRAAIDRMRADVRDTYAFSRMDVDESGANVRIIIWGVDAFGFRVDWWRENRRRFRSYVLGEPAFDNVFAAIMMTHGSGAIVNRSPDIRHPRHASNAGGAFARHNFYLAAVDARYFDLWARYVHALERLRHDGAAEEAELEMMRRMFVWRRSPARAVWHAGRWARASWRYARDRARFTSPAAAAPR